MAYIKNLKRRLYIITHVRLKLKVYGYESLFYLHLGNYLGTTHQFIARTLLNSLLFNTIRDL
jgi:hypothetical protein